MLKAISGGRAPIRTAPARVSSRARPERRLQLARVDSALQLGRASSAEERGASPVAARAVEEHRQAELVTDTPSERECHCLRKLHLVGPKRNDRDDVRCAHARVDPVVRPQIDHLCGAGDAREQRLDQIAVVRDDCEDRSVMIGVGVDVEDAPALCERLPDRGDDCRIASLGHVRHGFQDGHGSTLWCRRGAEP